MEVFCFVVLWIVRFGILVREIGGENGREI